MSEGEARSYFEKAWPRLNKLDDPWDRLSGKLGVVVLWWSHLETRLDMHMWGARNGDWSLQKSFEDRLASFWTEFGPLYPHEDGARLIELLIEANRVRNQLVHNVRYVGSIPGGAAWFKCVRPHRHFRKAEEKWLSGGSKSAPVAFEDQNIGEETLDVMMSVIVGGFEMLRQVRENSPR